MKKVRTLRTWIITALVLFNILVLAISLGMVATLE